MSTPSTLHYRSAWRSMRLGLVGWFILITGAVGLLFLFRRFFSFADEFSSRNLSVWFLIAAHLFYLGIGLYTAIRSYLPRQWKTELTLHLDEKTLERTFGGKTETLPFGRIDRVVYQGVSPVFVTHYLYWAEIGAERIPLIAFTRERESNDFYDLLERRAGLKVVQEASMP